MISGVTVDDRNIVVVGEDQDVEALNDLTISEGGVINLFLNLVPK